MNKQSVHPSDAAGDARPWQETPTAASLALLGKVIGALASWFLTLFSLYCAALAGSGAR